MIIGENERIRLGNLTNRLHPSTAHHHYTPSRVLHPSPETPPRIATRITPGSPDPRWGDTRENPAQGEFISRARVRVLQPTEHMEEGEWMDVYGYDRIDSMDGNTFCTSHHARRMQTKHCMNAMIR